LSVRLDLRLIRGHFIWEYKSIFTHLAHTLGEGIYSENEGNTTFRNLRTSHPKTKRHNPDALMFSCYLFEVSMCQ